jgi:hypothetical protein
MDFLPEYGISSNQSDKKKKNSDGTNSGFGDEHRSLVF